MFLRRFVRRKNGKPHTYWALAESYRTARGSRQRIVAYLGELNSDEEDGWTQLSSHLNGDTTSRRPQLTLFDPPQRDERRDDEPLLVKLSSIRLERIRDFGDVWLAWGLWRLLGLAGSFHAIACAPPRGTGWTELVLGDGTLIRVPSENLAALELVLSTLTGRSNATPDRETWHA